VVVEKAKGEVVLMSTLQPVVSACHEHQPSQDDMRARRTTVVIAPVSFIEDSPERTRVVWACSRRDCYNIGCEYSAARRRLKERGHEVG